MAFGTFNLFSFLQQPNTGVFPTPLGVGYLVGASGDVADFNWPFPYSGTSVPIEVVKGGGGAFQLKLFSDSYIGIRFATVNEVFSGNFLKDLETSHYSQTISGAFSPMDSGFYNSWAVFSGAINASPPDSGANYITLSGSIINRSPDFGLPFLIFSGGLLNCQPDNNNVIPTVSGAFSNGDYSNPTINIVFSGVFIPTNQDNTSISYGFKGMTTYNNVTIVDVSSGDSTCIRYGFSSFVSTRSS